MQNENLSQLGQSLPPHNRVSVLAFYWNHRDEAHRQFKLKLKSTWAFMWGDRRGGGGVGFFMYGFFGFDVHQYKHK